jgi:hypothetical protein
MSRHSHNKEPRIETVLSDSVEEVVEILPETALGVSKNPNTGAWELIEVKYNSVTGKAKLEVRHVQTDEQEARHQFKVMAYNRKLS